MTCRAGLSVLLSPGSSEARQAISAIPIVCLVHIELKMIVPVSQSHWNVITLIYSHIITSLSIHHHLLQARPLRNN